MQYFIDTQLSDGKQYKILDIGSRGVNGTYKGLFTSGNYQYTGLDIEEGPNVDIVPADIYSWAEIQDDQYDVVISGQAFEHIEFFWLTILEIARVLKKGGYVCLIAPNGFREHRHPVDCWRFFSDGMIALARWADLDVIHTHTNCAPSLQDHDWFSKSCADTMLIATKRYSGRPRTLDTSNYTCIPADTAETHTGMVTAKQYYSSHDVKLREAVATAKMFVNKKILKPFGLFKKKEAAH